MSATGLSGEELAARLEASRVLVADGKEFGDARYVRAAIRDRHAADRLLWAMRRGAGWPAVACRSRLENSAHWRVAAAIAVLAAMLTLAACGSEETSSGPQRLDLKIGNLVPRTGFLEQFGEPGQQAADLAVDEIRKAAAKAGAQHKVTITHVDYRSAPTQAVD